MALRLLRWLLVGVVLLTVASLTYNLLTKAPASRPPGLTFVRTGDLQTRYREWGTAGSPVILVPGAFETADTFAALGAVLDTDHRVYALDLTGTGYSQPRSPFTVAHFAAQVLAFAQAMRLTGPDAPVLVGHSSGAAVVGLAALEGGSGVAGVMFLDGDAEPLPGPTWPRRLVVDPFRTTLFRLGLRSDWVVRTLYSSQCGPSCPRLSAAGVEVWRRPLQQPGAEAALWSIQRSGIPSLTAAQLAALRASGVPKSVVFGADDPQYAASTPAAVAGRLGAPPPILVAGRHLTMISSPAQVASAVRALCARAAGRAAAAR